MAGKKVNKLALLTSLAAIVLAGESGGSAHEDVFADLANKGLVEVNNESYDPQTKIATVRATEAGVTAYNASLPPSFEIEKDVAIPLISGRGRTSAAEKYPFDQLEIGDSFFVGNSAEMPDASKSMNSTVSTANRRYREVVPGEFKEVDRDGQKVQVAVTRQLRKFVVRAVEDGKRGHGARVWRVEV